MKLSPRKAARTALIVLALTCVGAPLLIALMYKPIRVRIQARLGNSNSMFELGVAYSVSGGNQLLVRPDPDLAYYWLERAAEKGNVNAMWRMSNFAYDDSHKYTYVQKWLPRAAELGHLPSMIELSKAYQYGMYGFPKDPKLAQEWVTKVKRVPHHW